jgi:hypothetical protein
VFVTEGTVFALRQHALSGIPEGMKNPVTASRSYPVAFTSGLSRRVTEPRKGSAVA